MDTFKGTYDNDDRIVWFRDNVIKCLAKTKQKSWLIMKAVLKISHIDLVDYHFNHSKLKKIKIKKKSSQDTLNFFIQIPYTKTGTGRTAWSYRLHYTTILLQQDLRHRRFPPTPIPAWPRTGSGVTRDVGMYCYALCIPDETLACSPTHMSVTKHVLRLDPLCDEFHSFTTNEMLGVVRNNRNALRQRKISGHFCCLTAIF